jgi:hypothetical protein
VIVNNGGALMVNSDCDASVPALNMIGGGDIIAEGGIYYYKHGGWKQGGTGVMSPTPLPLTPRVPDPLAGMVPPDVYTTPTSPDSGGTMADPDTKTLNSGTHILRPGVYWGGLDIRSSASVTLEPGTYIMAGGGLALTGTGSVTGDGVFIYNTFDPENLAPNADGNCGIINLRGGADFTFTASSSGPYAHTLIWQDEACTDPVKFEGNGSGVSGVFYTPSARFDLAGSGELGAVQIVCKTIDITGTGDMTINFFPFFGLDELPGVVKLVE